jgi:hypothetical protein
LSSTALYGLRALGHHIGAVNLRSSPTPEAPMPIYYPPWAQLGDDGEEMEFYDGDSDAGGEH